LRGARYRWIILGCCILAYATSHLTRWSYTGLAPYISADLHLDKAALGLLGAAFFYPYALAQVPWGRLADTFGGRHVISLGVLAVASLLVGFATAASLGEAIGWRIAIGLVAACGFVPIASLLARWFAPRERGFAMGVKQTGLTLGGIAAALLLPPLSLLLGWRWSLAVAGAASLLSAGLAASGYRPPAWSLVEAPPEKPRLAEVAPFLARPGVRAVFGCGLALSMAQASVLAYLVLYAKEVLAVSVVDAGRLLALAQAGGAGARLGWGLISDRFFGGRRRPGMVVTALLGATSYGVFALGNLIPSQLTAPLAVVAGAGAFGWVGLYLALVAEIAGTRYAGLLTGVAVMFAWSGVLIGPPLFGLVLEATGSYIVPWLLLAACALVVAAALARLQPLVHRS